MKASSERGKQAPNSGRAEIASFDRITLDRAALGIFRVLAREWLLDGTWQAVEEHRNFPIHMYPVMETSTRQAVFGGPRCQFVALFTRLKVFNLKR